jgi:predicted esterase
MKLPRRPCLVALLLPLLTAGLASAQDFSPAPAQQLDDDTRKTIEQKVGKLGDTINFLRNQGLPKPYHLVEDPLLAEVEIYAEAARKIVRHNEFFQKESASWTLKTLDRGFERAKQAATSEYAWLKVRGKTVVRGYRSIIDGTIQPYAVTLPEDYGEDAKKKWRIDVVLHGRDANLTEVKFLNAFHDKPAPKGLDYVKIDIYGRGNNAYRWAGEIDILEALATFRTFEELLGRAKQLDFRRLVLRGFSMGGAGTWHLGLHRPDRYVVLGPGAGFSATHGYIKNLPKDLGWPQEQLLRIYDAVDYAENAFNVPIVAYAGSKDPQLQAARNIEAALKNTGLPVNFQILVAPDLEHKFPPEWQQKAEEAYAPFIAKGRADYPKRVRFVTYTLKYPICDWVEILGLVRHYDKAVVDAEKTEEGFKVTTTNVDLLRLRVPSGNLQDMTLLIDKQEVNARPWGTKGGNGFHVYLQRDAAGKWQATMPQKLDVAQARNPRKISGLQGPIDDAFTLPFLCVRGTGTGWSARTDEYAEANLKRFRAEWARYLRGELPIKDDVDVNADDIADKNLILFGDPASNTMIAQVLEGLPLTWTKETIQVRGTAKSFATASHVPALIYPNPLHPGKYVVLNSGHSFHAEDFQGTNALLYPRLGDYGVLELTAKGPPLGVERVALNGLFDERWNAFVPK